MAEKKTKNHSRVIYGISEALNRHLLFGWRSKCDGGSRQVASLWQGHGTRQDVGFPVTDKPGGSVLLLHKFTDEGSSIPADQREAIFPPRKLGHQRLKARAGVCLSCHPINGRAADLPAPARWRSHGPTQGGRFTGLP